MFPISCERVAVSLRGRVTTKFPVESRKSKWRHPSKGCFRKGTMSAWHHSCFPGFSGWCCFPLSERLGTVVRMLQGDGQKAPSRKAIRGSLSVKRGSCFGEGCTRDMLWLPKQASVLSFHFCSLSSPQIPVCKQPRGIRSSLRQEMCPIMHLAPGNPKFLGIIVRQVVTKGWLCLRAAAWQTAEWNTDKVTLWFWKRDPLFVLKLIASVTLQVLQTCPVWKCHNRLFTVFSTQLRFCWN